MQGRAETDCCLTYVKFEKIYPGDLTVRATTADGQSIDRTFTNSKKVRTAFVKANGKSDDDDDEDSTVQIKKGGLGRCIDIDVSWEDTSTIVITPPQGGKTVPTVTMQISHCRFQICCNNRHTGVGTKLIQVTPAPFRGGQEVKLPLLKIIDIRRDACP